MISALLLATFFAAGTDNLPDNLDGRWVPWLGCWELVSDEHREPLLGESDPTAGENVPKRGLVCLSPAPDGRGVTVTTAADGEAFLEETLVADGARNPSARGACAGWQRNTWSDDGFRLFTEAELTCNENRKLQVSGLSMMTERTTWVDIQIVESDAGRAVLIRRYRPADEEDVEAAGIEPLPAELTERAWRERFALTNPLDADDVAEAAQEVAPEAVEAAVLEHEEGFDLDSKTLIALDEAGVRPGLIDLMVALSYPDQFVVKRRETAGGGGVLGFPTFYGPGTVSYALGHPYYLAPFGYYYWYAPYDPYYVVRPVVGTSVSQGLVSRQGYAQVSPRPTTRRARYRGGHSGSSSFGSGSESGSGGSVSRQGYTRGGSSGRTAKPKNE